jgi:hypothetical protein
MALFGHADGPDQCPLMGLNRTWLIDAAMSQIKEVSAMPCCERAIRHHHEEAS